jgi:transposase
VYRAYQADPKKVKDWQERVYPALRAEATKEGAKIFFADEAGVRTDYHSGTTWAPVGQTPVVTATGERRSVNMVSAVVSIRPTRGILVGTLPLTRADARRLHGITEYLPAVSPVGELHFRVFEGKMNSETFIEYLRALLDDIPGKIFLIVDGASAHKSRATKAFVASTEGRLTLFLLPPYSPQLNPDEWVWSNVKSSRIGRSVAMSKDHLRQLAEAALQRLQNRPDIVRGFFGDRHLAYISAA